MDTPGLTIYNFPPQPPNLDALGIAYLSILVGWTSVVVTGAAYLIANRRHPIVRVRGLVLPLSAIAMLHAYWMLAQVVYPLGMTMNLVTAYDVQYFFMGIWLPLGIALFHASNSRFLHYAKSQKRFAEWGSRKKNCGGGGTSWFHRISHMDYANRILIYIGIGMVFQVILTISMWLACRKYHPTYGIPGSEVRGDNFMEQLADLGRGWEWWPTVFWQVIWTWVVAPVLIFKSAGIRDTLGWRMQTIGCCLSSLHATPLFLAACYSPAFAPINMYFAPSEWIHLSTMFFEIFTIFVPCWLVMKQKRQARKTLQMNEKWDSKSMTTEGTFSAPSMTVRSNTVRSSSSNASSSMHGKKKAHQARRSGPAALKCVGGGGGGDTSDSRAIDVDVNVVDDDDRLMCMRVLEHALRTDPQPLQDFSALRDFSGENIGFLTAVAAWKASWHAVADPPRVRAAFNRALGIYVEYVSAGEAEFPLNLSSGHLRHLDGVFGAPARSLPGRREVNPVTPFDFDLGSTQQNQTTASREINFLGEIPPGFGYDVFDSSESHIKVLVLTNTWPKYVKEVRRQSGSSEWTRTRDSEDSRGTFISRILSSV